jgi:hypothetical protein
LLQSWQLQESQYRNAAKHSQYSLRHFDFLQLHRLHKADLQLGGSDQWGNIISGVELARKVDQVQLFGLTAPLITTYFCLSDPTASVHVVAPVLVIVMANCGISPSA